MNTSEYANKRERNGAKKVSRHPLFQKMRQRALGAEELVVALRVRLAAQADLHAKDGEALLQALEEIKRLNKEGVIPDAVNVEDANAD